MGREEKDVLHPCHLLGETCRGVREQSREGAEVAVVGTLTQRTYEKDGEKRYAYEVLAREVEFGEKARGAEAGATSVGAFAGTTIPDDDIPF